MCETIERPIFCSVAYILPIEIFKLILKSDILSAIRGWYTVQLYDPEYGVYTLIWGHSSAILRTVESSRMSCCCSSFYN